MLELISLRFRPIGESVLALGVGLIIVFLLLFSQGYDIVQSMNYMLVYPLSNSMSIVTILSKMGPYILTGLVFAIGFRAAAFNIGGEGQMLMGAVGAVAAGGLIALPPGIHHIVTFLFAVGCGFLWVIPVAILKLTRGVHEVVVCLMMNYIGAFFAMFLFTSYLNNPTYPYKSIAINSSARLPVLVEGSVLTAGIILALIASVLFYILLYHTQLGSHIRATGLNTETSRNSGIDVKRALLFGFLLGGLAAGAAGLLLTAGQPPTYTALRNLENLMDIGWAGIAVSVIGRNHPLGVIFGAFVFSLLIVGGMISQAIMGIPPEMSILVQGVVLVVLAVPEIYHMIERLHSRTRR